MSEEAGRPNCADCVHFFLDRPKLGHCRRYPPTVFAMAQPHPLRPHEAEMIPASFYPPVRADHGCGEHPQFALWLKTPLH